MQREFTVGTMLLAGVLTAATAAGADPVPKAAEGRIMLAQSVNETMPGGVENRPGGADRSAAPVRGMTKPSQPIAPAPVQAPALSAPAAAPLPQEAPAAKKKKAPSPSRSMDTVPGGVERAYPSSEGLPQPKKPDDSIPGGVERSPSANQR